MIITILKYLIILIIGMILGAILNIIFTRHVGTLEINEGSDKDVLKFAFEVPPEDVVANRDQAIVTIKIVKNSQKDQPTI